MAALGEGFLSGLFGQAQLSGYGYGQQQLQNQQYAYTSGTASSTYIVDYGVQAEAPVAKKVATALDWLDRRVNEIRVKL